MNYAQLLPTSDKINTYHNSFLSSHLLNNTHIAPEYTIASVVQCSGIGLHTGKLVHLKMIPAPPGTGIVFYRSDFKNHPIQAHFTNVVETTLSTVIAAPNHPEISISTIEHLMAALMGNEIQNVTIECSGPEIPIMDGSSARFDALLQKAGRQRLFSITPIIKITKTIRVEHKDSFAELHPSVHNELSLSLSIDFPASLIGKQQFNMQFNQENYQTYLAHCRTFTLKKEIDTLHKMGLAKGGSLDNAIVVDNDRILNPEGLYCKDEFVKHKMLDALGDLSLLGCKIFGKFTGHKSGHKLNNTLLHQLMKEKDSWHYHIPPHYSLTSILPKNKF